MIAERVMTLKAHSGPLYALAEGRNKNLLFSGGGDHVVAEWDVQLGTTQPFGIRTDNTIYSLLNLDRKTLLIGTSQGSIHVIDLETKKEKRHLKLHDKGIFHLAYLPEKNRVYAACADGSVSIWEASQWSLLWHLELSQGKIRRIAFDSEGKLAALTSGDGRVFILDTNEHKVKYSIEAHEDSVNSVAFLPNGNLLTGGKDAHLSIWDGKNHFRNLRKIPAHNYAIYDILVHPEGKWVASASRDKTVKLWDIDLMEKPIRLDRKGLEGHTHSVNRLNYLAEEDMLASCSDDRTICLWRVK